MASLTCALVFKERPSELGAIQECIFNGAEFSPLVVDQLSSGKRAQIDRVHDEAAGLELPHFDSVPSSLVFTRSHVPLDAAHRHARRGIDMPRLFTLPPDVKANPPSKPGKAKAGWLAVVPSICFHFQEAARNKISSLGGVTIQVRGEWNYG